MDTKYLCLKKNTYTDSEGYKLVPLRSEDLEKIRLWRNAQLEILRQKIAIDSQMQQDYFREVIVPTFTQKQPLQILFSFFYHDACIGYGGLTHIDWESKRAEVSFLVDPAKIQTKEYKKDHHHFLKLLCLVAFKDLALHRLFTETFQFRDQHIKQLEEFGFKREGVMREHVFKGEKWQDSIIHGLLTHEYRNEE